MPVQNRIKIIQVNSLEEVENKVNDFLAFNEHIAELVHVDYRLESNFVIIEYYIMNNDDNNNNEKNNNKMMMEGSGDYSYYTYNTGPLTYWMRFLNPFFLPNG